MKPENWREVCTSLLGLCRALPAPAGQRQRQLAPILAQETETETDRVFWHLLVLGVESGPTLLCSNRALPFRIVLSQEVDGSQFIRIMPDNHDESANERLSAYPSSGLGRYLRGLAAAAMAVALLQTIPVAAKATGDVEVPYLSQQVLARSEVHDVRGDLEPPRARIHGTNRGTLEIRGTNRNQGHRNGNPKSQAATSGRSNAGFSPGTTSQSREKFGTRGGTADSGAAIDGRSKNRDDDGGQASGRGQTACSPRHVVADAEVLVQALRVHPQQQNFDAAAREALIRMTDALTNMRAAQQVQHQGKAPVAPLTPTVTQGSEPLQELPVTQDPALLREAMRQAEATAVGQSPQGVSTPQERRRQPKREEVREGLESDLGEHWTEINEELRSKFIQAVNNRFVPY